MSFRIRDKTLIIIIGLDRKKHCPATVQGSFMPKRANIFNETLWIMAFDWWYFKRYDTHVDVWFDPIENIWVNIVCIQD